MYVCFLQVQQLNSSKCNWHACILFLFSVWSSVWCHCAAQYVINIFVGVLRPCSMWVMIGDKVKRFKSQYRGKAFSVHTIWSSFRSSQPPIQGIPVVLSLVGCISHGMQLTSHFHLPLKLRMGISNHPCKFFWICSIHVPICIVSNSGKIKGKVYPRTGHAGQTGEQRCSSNVSFTSVVDGDGWWTPHPCHLMHRERDPQSIAQQAGWALRPIWKGAETLASKEIKYPHHPTCSKLLYLLRYPGQRHNSDNHNVYFTSLYASKMHNRSY